MKQQKRARVLSASVSQVRFSLNTENTMFFIYFLLLKENFMFCFERKKLCFFICFH